MMKVAFQRIDYSQLNARQKENYNFQKISGILADFGFSTIRLSDDWQGADFIAQHIDGTIFLKVQLKGRLTLFRKYIGKDLWVCFREKDEWYLCPHDLVLEVILAETQMASTESWRVDGFYTYPTLSVAMKHRLRSYRVAESEHPTE